MANEELINGELEGPYTAREAGEVVVAEGWEPWYDHGKARPEWKAEVLTIGKGRVHSGEAAQKQFTTYKVHDAGIWQRVNAVPRQWYRVRAWLYMWSSDEDDPDKSVKSGKMHAMVGFNPWGHWPQHTATIWGREIDQDQYNQWVEVEVIAEAWASEVSIIVRSWNEWKAKHNDLYIDDVTLEPIAVTIGEPGAQPQRQSRSQASPSSSTMPASPPRPPRLRSSSSRPQTPISSLTCWPKHSTTSRGHSYDHIPQ